MAKLKPLDRDIIQILNPVKHYTAFSEAQLFKDNQTMGSTNLNWVRGDRREKFSTLGNLHLIVLK